MGHDQLLTADTSPAVTPSDEPASQYEAAEVSHKFVSFFIEDRHYAVSARAVAEVTGHLAATPLPNSPSSLLGIAPHRGDILAVVDAGKPSLASNVDKRKAIVLRPVGEGTEVPVAFNVDRIGELLQISAREFKTASQVDPLSEFQIDHGDKSVLIVEPSRIVGLLYA